MRWCPTCGVTEEDDEPGLVNLHHEYPGDKETGVAGHHTAEEHDGGH